MKSSASSHFARERHCKKRVSFQIAQKSFDTGITQSTQDALRSILKSRQPSNLLKMANDKMLRELEQCVETRDRLSASIAAIPEDLFQLSPRTRSAQTRYREEIADEKRRISELIEDKYSLLKETLTDNNDMPVWLRAKDDSAALTLIGYKKAGQLKLFRRQSSLFAFQQQIEKMRSVCATDLSDFSRKLERLRSKFSRGDSEAQLGYDASGLIARISQRLAIA